MPNYCKVEIEGHAGKDATVKYTQSGKAVLNVSVATGGKKKADGGEWPTQWHNVVYWPKEEPPTIRKGDAVKLSGTIEYRSWDDKATGLKKWATDIKAFELFVEPKQAREQQTKPIPVNVHNQHITDDDIPF